MGRYRGGSIYIYIYISICVCKCTYARIQCMPYTKHWQIEKTAPDSNKGPAKAPVGKFLGYITSCRTEKLLSIFFTHLTDFEDTVLYGPSRVLCSRLWHGPVWATVSMYGRPQAHGRAMRRLTRVWLSLHVEPYVRLNMSPPILGTVLYHIRNLYPT